ncbi:MAG: PAS domain S-box protein [Ignavibacteria bacterium]|nr:PAS domain S-box protein [Ignavibacteria bacterium]
MFLKIERNFSLWVFVALISFVWVINQVQSKIIDFIDIFDPFLLFYSTISLAIFLKKKKGLSTRNLKSLLNSAVFNSKIPIAIVSSNGIILYSNCAFQNLTKKSKPEGEPIFSLLELKFVENGKRLDVSIFDNFGVENYKSFEKIAFLNQENDEIIFDLLVEKPSESQTKGGSFVLYFFDVSENYRKSKELIFKQEQYKHLLNLFSEGYALIEKSGTILDCNKIFCEIFEENPGEPIGKNIQIYLQKCESPNVEANLEKNTNKIRWEDILDSIENGNYTTTFECWLKINSRNTKFYFLSFQKIKNDDSNNFALTIKDITETREKAKQIELIEELYERIKDKDNRIENLQKQIANSQAQNQNLLNLISIKENFHLSFLAEIPVGVYRTDEEGNFLYANEALAKILGCETVDDLMRLNAYSFYHNREEREKVLELHSKSESKYITTIVKFKKKGGETIYAHDYGKITRDLETGKTVFEGIIIDITKEVLAQIELEQSERRFRRFFSRMTELFIRIDKNGLIKLVSPSVKTILNYETTELVNRYLSKLLVEPDFFDKIQSTLEAKGILYDILIKLKAKDGDVKILKGDLVCAKSKIGKIIGCDLLLRDVTSEIEHKNFMTVIFEITHHFNEYKNIEVILQEIIRTLSFISIDSNFIFGIYDEESNSLKILKHADRFGKKFEEIGIDSKNPLTHSFLARKTIIADENELQELWAGFEVPVPKKLIALPLSYLSKSIGVMGIYTYSYPENLEKINIFYLSLISEQISIGLQKKLAEDKLTLQLKLFETLIETIPYPIYYRSLLTGKYKVCNQAFVSFVGKSKEEIIGSEPRFILPNDFYKAFYSDLSPSQNAIKPVAVEISHTNPKGKELVYFCIRSYFAIADTHEGEEVGTFIDVTERAHFARKLQDALNFNNLLLGLVPNAIYFVDTDRRVTFWNTQAKRITGFDETEVLGKFPLFCESNCKEFCPLLVKESKQILENELEIVTKSGEKKIISKSATPMIDAKGNLIGVIETFQDVTEEKKFENRLKYLADSNARLSSLAQFASSIKDTTTLIDALLPVAIHITNSAGAVFYQIEELNGTSAITKLTSYIEQIPEILSVNIPLEQISHCYVCRTLIFREPMVVENANLNFLLPEEVFLVNQRLLVTPIAVGDKFIGVILVFGKENEYTTEEINSMERLSMIFATNFERIVYQDEIYKALVKEQQLNELRTNFISMISHEYRTPLQAIILSVEILKKHYAKLSPDEKQKQFERIEKAIQDMATMIDNVILYNRITSTESVFLEKVNPKLFFESLVRDFELYYFDKAQIICEIDVKRKQAKIDTKLTQLIFSNIIGNGIKYSQPNSILNIQIEEEENNFLIRIKDNGIGIPKKDLDKIFQPFYRGENTKTISGTGLGLSIVKKAIDLLGGSISVESQIGEGTTFTIQLPIFN